MGSKKSSNKGLLIYVLVLIGVMILIVGLMKQSTKTASEYTYSEIMSFFDNYQVSEYTFDLGTGELNMTVNLEDGTAKDIGYTVPNVSVFLNEIQTGTENYRREYNKLNPDAPLNMEYYKIQDTTWLYNLLPSLVIIIMMVALFVFMMRQMGGGGKINSFSKANVKTTSNTKHTFEDVAGADEEKAELAEIVDFLKNPKKYNDIGARIPKGVLLMGPPGTGKTLLAKAVAGEAGVPFFSISGSDFVELYVGVGASRVRDLFETAKKNSPSIIFIDEIDAVGRQRGAGLGGGHDEREQTLNQLLVEMDGFEGNEGVIVIAATNRRDILDPALLRPGRFDREVMVGYPDVKGREAILRVHAKNKPLGPDVDLNVIAKTTQFFTGADLENLLNEAALLAARHDRKSIIEADIEEATLKVIAGPERKSALVTERDRKITAYHEAGHAVAAFFLPECEKVHQVTTIQRGMAAGLTVCRPETDDSHVTKGKMYQDIVMTMGGRVAEALNFEDVCTGASGDIQQATKRARAMVTQYGFSEKLGPVQYGGGNNEVFLGRDYGHTQNYSESTANLIDEEIKSIITKAYDECTALLTEHADKVKELAEYLIENEKIDGDGFEKLMKGELDWRKPKEEAPKADTENTDAETSEAAGNAETQETTDETASDNE
ncbi:MAG: ATP-dependent zinc metalloprotease FtsH [Oscillospiraceae bacterium]|nr:ATP-dependent zinc metalloprotease FtsH [Oscillospiraceae bacterium]